jgi:hypothetical protein
MAREQLKNELKLYSFDYESVIANPLEFTWLDLNYYDTKQHELESLGFQKIDDSEFLPLTKAFPDIRTFSRRFINAEQDIEASITQIRIKKPAYEYENIQERLLNQRIVKFYSEFSDNTFIETDNTRLITPIKGIELLAFVPTISLEELLDAHEKKIETICETKNVNTIIHRNANEISEAAKRRFLSLGKYLNEKNNITELEFTRIRLIARKYGGYNAVIKTYLAEYNEQVQKKQENELPQS